jgi:putative flippase GtrA
MKNTKLYGVARKNKKEVKRFGKFAIVGLSGLVIDVLLLNILERYFGFSVPLAVAVAFIVAATNNFVWNRLWVYPESRTQPKRKQLPTFLAVNAAGLVINEIIFLLFQASITSLVLLIPISLVVKHHQGIGLNVTKAIAAVVVMVWNFVVNRMVTFRDVKWQTNTGAPLPPAADDDERIDSAL